MKKFVLIVEDQKEISDIVAKYIEKEGYDYFVANDGFKALEFINNNKVHLVLLDVMMPGIDGFDVLREIRTISDMPVLMLTAKEQEEDRIKGFDIGADDYIIKPFSVRELMRRIKVILKRVYHENDEKSYTYHDLSLNTSSMKLFKSDVEIAITSSEFNLLKTFFVNKGQVLSREQLIELAFGDDYDGFDRSIDTHIKRIRHKIEKNPKKPEVLITKYGAGYIFGGD
ncbi:MAG: response regulator transcription factor [Acidaminobacteraceae bacterium]